jgi:F0F1-type ATP synthase assembly protein I
MAQSDRKKQDEREPPIVELARYSGLGLQLAGSVGLFMAGGWWLDGKLGTTPLLTIIGALGGGAAAFYSIYQHLVKRRGGKPPKP